MTGRTDMDFQDFDGRDADAPNVPELDFTEPPLGSDRRAFMMRSALVSAMAVLAGRPMTALARRYRSLSSRDSAPRRCFLRWDAPCSGPSSNDF